MSTVNESIRSGVIFRILAAINPVTWNRISFWTKAADVHFDDANLDDAANSLQNKIGSISGITSDTSSTSPNMAASAEMVNGYNNGAAIVLETTSWSNGTTSVNGTDYYTATVSCGSNGKVWTTNPIAILSTTVQNELIPSTAELNAYNNIAYIIADSTNNTVTFYATEKPAVSLKVIVKGVVISNG